jgi:hypothetical protein
MLHAHSPERHALSLAVRRDRFSSLGVLADWTTGISRLAGSLGRRCPGCFAAYYPVADTALYIVDQYPTTRALSTPATLWVIVSAIERRWIRAGLCLLFTGLIHPLMVVFCLAYVVLLLFVGSNPFTHVPAEASRRWLRWCFHWEGFPP